MDNGLLLATCSAVASSGLTLMLAEHRGQTPEQFLDRFAEVQRELDPEGADELDLTPLMRSLFLDDRMESSVQIFAKTWAEDQAKFLDMILELGSYAATCIEFLDALKASTVEETLDDLDAMLRQFVGA
ncbi:hypothetical protein [Streptomyces sp. HUAS TT7]|uniref:hypothetical protein n=1 Tax=Streptomyces sp. HUAS TT7 TaxID=3447507 RepID=UPI003F65E711